LSEKSNSGSFNPSSSIIRISFLWNSSSIFCTVYLFGLNVPATHAPVITNETAIPKYIILLRYFFIITYDACGPRFLEIWPISGTRGTRAHVLCIVNLYCNLLFCCGFFFCFHFVLRFVLCFCISHRVIPVCL